jgi:hypothetical protein
MIMPTKEHTGLFAARGHADLASDYESSDTQRTEWYSGLKWGQGSKTAEEKFENDFTDITKNCSPDELVENAETGARSAVAAVQTKQINVLQEFVVRVDKILNATAYLTLWGEDSEFNAERPVTEFGNITVIEGDYLDFKVLIEDNSLKQEFQRREKAEVDPIAFADFCRTIEEIYSE